MEPTPARASALIGADRRIALAEERVRMHMRDADSTARRNRDLEAEVAALRHELTIAHAALGQSSWGTMELFRALSDRAFLLEEIRVHRDRYRQRRMSAVHPHDARLYAAAKQITDRTENPDEEPSDRDP